MHNGFRKNGATTIKGGIGVSEIGQKGVEVAFMVVGLFLGLLALLPFQLIDRIRRQFSLFFFEEETGRTCTNLDKL